MAANKSRLGRGLESLISGGVSTPKSNVPPAPRSKSRKPKSAAAKGSRKQKPAAKSASAKKVPAKKVSARKATPAKVVKKTKPTAIEGSVPPPAKATPETMASTSGLAEIPVGKIEPNPHQPRKSFNDESLNELAESIRSEGLLQPIVVRIVGESYQLIAGERRWRACQMLKLKKVPARIIEAGETSSAVMSLIENLQRENLNPIEEALGYASLLSDFGLTQEAVAERVGKSRAAVANSLRLLQLDREIQGFISKGLVSVGHAKVLLGLDGNEERVLLARQIIERGLSVRETEKAVHARRKGGSLTNANTPGRTVPAAEAAAIADLQRTLSNTLSTRVQLKHTPKKGKLVIEYFGNDDLQRILEKMGLAT